MAGSILATHASFDLHLGFLYYFKQKGVQSLYYETYVYWQIEYVSIRIIAVALTANPSTG